VTAGFRRTAAALTVAASLSGCAIGDTDDQDATAPRASSPSASPVSLLPSLAGPKTLSAFEFIRAFGVRPGSRDDLMIRDLIAVAEAQRAHLAVHGRLGTLEEVQQATGVKLRGGQLQLVSGTGQSPRFCLRAYVNDEDPRQWYFDTDRVLPRGESCT